MYIKMIMIILLLMVTYIQHNGNEYALNGKSYNPFINGNLYLT
jgi:hypothetical protein